MIKPKNKRSRIYVIIECSTCRKNINKRSAGVSRYLTTKNRKNFPKKLILYKYCPNCNKHVEHKEIK